MKLVLGVLLVSLYVVVDSSLVDLCAELVEHDLHAPPRLEEWCEIQMAIVHLQATADALSQQEFQLAEKSEGVKDKRKNEFIRFGKRSEVAEGGEEQTQGVEKRKNEFIRFGKRKNEFIRFGKRKNEFIRFGKKSDGEQTAIKRKFVSYAKKDSAAVASTPEKRKNEFIRFG